MAFGNALRRRLHRRQRVDHVSHRTEAHDQQALHLRVPDRSSQDFLEESRERMISLVE